MSDVAPWLTDYSNYSAAGGAFEGFAKALTDAQDRAMKRQEFQARLGAMQTQMQREQDTTNLEAMKMGLQKSASGSFEPTTLPPAEQMKQQTSDFAAGAKRDQSGNLVYDPQSLKARMADLSIQRMQNMFGLQNERLNLMKDRFGETQNQNAASAGKTIQDDQLIKDMTTARYSLSRGKSLLNGQMPLTYNNLNAVQQDVINGMVKGGQSSEGKVSREMQESWIGNWNNILHKAGQYGPDVDIRKQDPGLYKQIQGLLEEVDGTIATNMNDRKANLGSIYSESTNPKVRETIKKQLSPEGLIQPQGGLVAPGLVKPEQSTQAPVAPVAAEHPQAGAALQWAKENPKDPRSAAILKALGVK